MLVYLMTVGCGLRHVVIIDAVVQGGWDQSTY